MTNINDQNLVAAYENQELKTNQGFDYANPDLWHEIMNDSEGE